MESPKKEPIEKSSPDEKMAAPNGEEKPAVVDRFAPAPAETPKSNRAPSIWRRLLRGLLGILILFSLGALTILLVFYLPLRQELEVARAEIEALNQKTASELQNANEEINRLSSLESSQEDLQTRLDQATRSLVLLQIRYDVTSAQLALADKNAAKARLALSNTEASLKTLEGLLPQAQRDVIADLLTRLKLVLSEMDEKTYAARSDLDVMANLLLELETALNR
jgi:hypothetical protein